MHTHLQWMTHYFSVHPHMGTLLTGLLSFLESLAIIGSIVPGSVTMTAIGILVGTQVLPITDTLLCAIIGALSGDYVSYWVGHRYQKTLRAMPIFQRYQRFFVLGETFFRQHGRKSLVLGRFIGPMRSMVPMIAGMLNMNARQCVPAFILSAALWAIVYLSPGYLIGAFARTLPPKVATHFIMIIFAILIVLWCIVLLVRYALQQIARALRYTAKQLWKQLTPYHRLRCWISNNPNDPQPERQCLRLGFALLCAVGMLLLSIAVAYEYQITQLNTPFFYMLRNLHNHFGDHIMVAFTLMADKKVLLSTAAGLSCWLAFKKEWRLLIHWLFLTGITAGSVLCLKHLIAYPRPIHLGYSFPSGHTTLLVSLATFITSITAPAFSPKRRNLIYYILAGFIACVALSRLYLGAHWLTDVIGACLLSGTLSLCAQFHYQRKTTLSSPNTPNYCRVLLSIATGLWLTIGSFYTITHYDHASQGYVLHWPTQSITYNDWWQQDPTLLPHYRANRLGQFTQAFNVQWLGSLSSIRKTLTAQGWQVYYLENQIARTLKHIARKPSTHHYLPWFPLTYQNQPPMLVLIQLQPSCTTILESCQGKASGSGSSHPHTSTSVCCNPHKLRVKHAQAHDPEFFENTTHSTRPLILRLWRTHIQVYGHTPKEPLWLGTIGYPLLPHPKNTWLNTTNLLIPYLYHQHWRCLHIPTEQHPPALQQQPWDGKILLIHSRV